MHRCFDLPFRGSYIILFLVGSLFLLTCMGIGLLVSTIFKNQFLACQISLVMGFLPALLLSGLMFPISSMPAFFRYLTAVLPQRYFVSFIESEFLAGTISDQFHESVDYFSILEEIKTQYTNISKKYSEDILPALINSLNFVFSSKRKKDYEDLIILLNTIKAFVDEIELELPPITNDELIIKKDTYFSKKGRDR